MSCIVEIDSKYFIYSKGAPDFLLPECTRYVANNGEIKNVDEDFKNLLKYNLGQFAAGSLRTLLVCYKELTKKEAENEHPEQNESGLIILGLAGIKDPLKKGIPEAVNKCKQAGIIVRMVTGDIRETAVAIARDANIIPHAYERPEKGQSGYYVVMEGKEFREAVGGLIEDE
jgi:magnesium-transporting ATPase (P-type)